MKIGLSRREFLECTDQGTLIIYKSEVILKDLIPWEGNITPYTPEALVLQ